MIGRPHAIVCPGQGSQHPRMIDALPDQPAVRRLLDAGEALTDSDLAAIDSLADPAELADTRVAQPLLYLADWAWGRALLDAGLAPLAIAGHSLGEFAALALAGVFSVEAGLHLVVERSTLMARAAADTPGAMAAVLGLSAAEIHDVLDPLEGIWLANDNCPGQLVVSGTQDGIERSEPLLLGAGAKRVIPLAVSGGFHTPLMEPAADAFRHILASTDFADARIPVVQNAHPTEPATDAGIISERLSLQMTSPVRWTETMATLRALGAEVLVEAGPGKVLSGLARRFDGLEGMPVEEPGIGSVVQEVLA